MQRILKYAIEMSQMHTTTEKYASFEETYINTHWETKVIKILNIYKM